MVERNIPRDMAKYQSKFLGPLTKRQLIFGVPAVVLALGVYFLTKDHIGELAILLAIIVGGPLMLCAIYQPYNVPFEKFAKTVLVTYLMSPQKRLYKAEGSYDKAFRKLASADNETERKKSKSIKKGKKFVSKDPDCQSL